MNYFCVFGDFYASGIQDAEVTKSLDTLQIRKQMLSGFRSEDGNRKIRGKCSSPQKTFLRLLECGCVFAPPATARGGTYALLLQLNPFMITT